MESNSNLARNDPLPIVPTDPNEAVNDFVVSVAECDDFAVVFVVISVVLVAFVVVVHFHLLL
ncbi:hypothetical protein D3C80_2218740 [compost metagenome]